MLLTGSVVWPEPSEAKSMLPARYKGETSIDPPTSNNILQSTLPGIQGYRNNHRFVISGKVFGRLDFDWWSFEPSLVMKDFDEKCKIRHIAYCESYLMFATSSWFSCLVWGCLILILLRMCKVWTGARLSPGSGWSAQLQQQQQARESRPLNTVTVSH